MNNKTNTIDFDNYEHTPSILRDNLVLDDFLTDYLKISPYGCDEFLEIVKITLTRYNNVIEIFKEKFNKNIEFKINENNEIIVVVV